MASVLQPENSLPSVRATIQFTKNDGSTPVSIVREAGTGPDTRNGKYEDHEISIYDGRSIAKDLTLDNHGFTLTRFPTAVKDFYDDDEVLSVYYPEMEEIVKQATGCSKVVVFDHTIRVDDEATQTDRKVRGPVKNVHNDFTRNSANLNMKWEHTKAMFKIESEVDDLVMADISTERQTELMYMKREHRLEEEYADIEYQIRVLMAKSDALRTDDDRAKEEASADGAAPPPPPVVPPQEPDASQKDPSALASELQGQVERVTACADRLHARLKPHKMPGEAEGADASAASAAANDPGEDGSDDGAEASTDDGEAAEKAVGVDASSEGNAGGGGDA